MSTHSTLIELDDDVRRAAERVAEGEGTTLSALVERALRAFFASHGAYPHLIVPTAGEGGVAPGVDINNNALLWALLDEGVPIEKLR